MDKQIAARRQSRLLMLPLLTFALLLASMWLISATQNAFILLLPVALAFWSFKQRARNKWYRLPLGLGLAIVAILGLGLLSSGFSW